MRTLGGPTFLLLAVVLSSSASPAADQTRPLELAWSAWKAADAANKTEAAEAARVRLLQLAKDTGSAKLEGYAVGFMRAARAHGRAGDADGAVALASGAVELAPDLPMARFTLASSYFAADPAQLGRPLGELKQAVQLTWEDPRQRRLVLGDFGVALVFGVMGLAVAVSLTFFVRSGRYALHDLRHLLPKRTHVAIAGVFFALLILLPIAFRLGVWSLLCGLLATTTLYLTRSERMVYAISLSLMALVPSLGERLVQHAAFAGTSSEDVYRLERSAPGAAVAAQRVDERAAEGKADPTELVALGRYRLAHGAPADAVKLFEKAAELRTNDARLLVNMGNALLVSGNIEGALQNYKAATTADPQSADALFNLGKLHLDRAKALPEEQAADERGRGETALQMAVALDPALEERKALQPAPDAPLRGLQSPTITDAELRSLQHPPERAEAVRRQLAGWLFGGTGDAGAVLPIAVVAGLFIIGMFSRGLGASRACLRCGGAICRRCHPSLRPTSLDCGECAHVFSRAADVPAAAQVRKQIEIAQHQSRRQRLSFLAAVIIAGGGHLLNGAPVRGAVFGIIASFLGSSLLFHGLFRGPYGGLPLVMTLVPLGLCLLIVSLLSLRDLRRRLEVG